MAVGLAPVLRQRFFTTNGAPLAGGKLYSYQTGTTTPQATYTDETGGTPNANPVILDANGEANVWLDQTLSYKFILKDSSDVQQWVRDGVIGILNTNSVTTAALQDGSVTTVKVADLAVTLPKISTTLFSALTAATPELDDYVAIADTSASSVNKKATIADILNLICPIGIVVEWPKTTVPSALFLPLNGAPVSRTTYATLFALYGTAFGTGDGTTTFNVPDRRWYAPRGYGANIAAACSGSAATNNVTATAHGFNRSGVRCRVTGTPVTGLSLSTDYFTIYVDANTLAFATTRANALAGTKIAISGSAGSQTVIQYEDPDASTREGIAAGASTGAAIGTVQEDEFESHIHQQTNNTGGGGTFLVGASQSGSGQQANGYTYATGGSETRMKNVYTNWFVRAL